MNKYTVWWVAGGILIVIVILLGFWSVPDPEVSEDMIPGDREELPVSPIVDQDDEETQPEQGAVFENLTIPWEIAFLPNGDMLVTERPGTIRYVGEESTTFSVEGVEHIGEGGLLGMAVHPEFERNGFVYVYHTLRSDGSIQNRILRYHVVDGNFTDPVPVLEGIPGARFHNGGRIMFGPDGYLYVTTGDAQDPPLSQDMGSLAGKILRITEDGDPAPRNPFDNEVYSFGHRNPQGLAWDNEGRLWSTEHGARAHDELNLIEPGRNYGWPDIQGDEEQSGMETPVLHSGAGDTWAPSGAAFWNERLFFGGLRGSTLYEVNLEDRSINQHFAGEFGRIRVVVVGPDGFLYIATSNRDGRGIPRPGDDKIIRIPEL